MVSLLSEPQLGSRLRTVLTRCSTACEDALAEYAEEHPRAPTTSFGSTLLLASAALGALADLAEDDPRRGLSLMIAVTLARESADRIRRFGLDERLLRCAALCDQAADLCEATLKR